MTLPQQLASREDWQNNAHLSLVELYRIYGEAGFSRGTIHRAWQTTQNSRSNGEGNGMQEGLVSAFMGDVATDGEPTDALFGKVVSGTSIFGTVQVDEQVDELSQFATTSPDVLFEPEAEEPEIITQTYAEHLLSQALSRGKDLIRILKKIQDTKAYLLLGCDSWDAFYKKYQEKILIDKATYYRQVNYQTRRQELAAANIPVRELKPVHTEIISAIPDPEKRVAVWEKSIEIAAADVPDGRHHPGTVFSRHVEQAKREILGDTIEDDEPDPFDPNTRRSVAQKPLPPKQPTAPISPTDRPLADYICCEYRKGAEAMFISFRVAPGEEYEAWVPVQEIRRALGL